MVHETLQLPKYRVVNETLRLPKSHMVDETLRIPKCHVADETLQSPRSHVVHETLRLPKSYMVDETLQVPRSHIVRTHLTHLINASVGSKMTCKRHLGVGAVRPSWAHARPTGQNANARQKAHLNECLALFSPVENSFQFPVRARSVTRRAVPPLR
jgi:hypothetical protein